MSFIKGANSVGNVVVATVAPAGEGCVGNLG
jgi:hypothetical protein